MLVRSGDSEARASVASARDALLSRVHALGAM